MSRPSSFLDKLEHPLKAENSNELRLFLEDECLAEKISVDILQVLCRTLQTRRPELLTILLDDHQLSPKVKQCLVKRHSGNPIMRALIAGQKIGNHLPGLGGVDSDVSKMVTKLLDTVQDELGPQLSMSNGTSRLGYGKPPSGERGNFILHEKITGYGNPVLPAELADLGRLHKTASILKCRASPNPAQTPSYQAQNRSSHM